MDLLSDLPVVAETSSTPAELEVMQRFFTKHARTGAPAAKHAAKTAFFLTLLFVVLAHPWCDAVLSKVPKCDESPLMRFAVRVLLFFLLAFVLEKWVI
uniref:Uncharacterized protein n=1 Tax=Marseillevirus LCMAC103 TaxID=2506604 RepID=A0A481YVT7_9VIRU|nr:MAG: uncharacterized protein LCMAC103_03610 [Marseillevirus LCMAC103]